MNGTISSRHFAQLIST